MKVKTYLCAARWTDRWLTTVSNDLRPTEDEQTWHHRVIPPIRAQAGQHFNNRPFYKIFALVCFSLYSRKKKKEKLLQHMLLIFYKATHTHTIWIGAHQPSDKWSFSAVNIIRVAWKTHIPELKHVRCVDAEILHFGLAKGREQRTS